MDKNKSKEELEKTLQGMTSFWDMSKECADIRTKAQTHICDIVERFGKSVGKDVMRFTFKRGNKLRLTILSKENMASVLRFATISAVEVSGRTESSLGSIVLYEGRKACCGTLLSTEAWLSLYAGLHIAACRMLGEME